MSSPEDKMTEANKEDLRNEFQLEAQEHLGEVQHLLEDPKFRAKVVANDEVDFRELLSVHDSLMETCEVHELAHELELLTGMRDYIVKWVVEHR